jgi:hypothetical protein
MLDDREGHWFVGGQTMKFSISLISISCLKRHWQSTKHKSHCVSALLLSCLVMLQLGACASSETSITSSAASSAAADHAAMTLARGKRISVRVTNGCSDDDDCGLGAPALKTKLDAILSQSGVFAAVSDERPDFRLNVVMKTLGDQSPISFYDDYEAKADFQFADITGKILSSGSVSGSSGDSDEQALDKMAAQLGAKMRP